MKKFICFLLAAALLSGAAFADGGAAVRSSVGLHIIVEPNGADGGDAAILRFSFELRDGATGELLSTQGIELLSDANARRVYFDLSFPVREYEIGKVFLLYMTEGEGELEFDGNRGAFFALQTYSAPNSSATALEYCSDFYMKLYPTARKTARLRLDGEERRDLALYPYAEGILIAGEALSALGIGFSRADDGAGVLSRGEKSVALYADSAIAYTNEGATELTLAPKEIGGELYVPVADMAQLFGCAVDYGDDGRTLSLSLGYSSVSRSGDEVFINGRNLPSETNYLIWVSKSEYRVRVYKGENGSRHLISSFPCAIGAAGTPTCEGVFKYYQYQTRWEYASYYVGPVMRFNGGFAIHSTLLRYNGSDYDGRVGARLSHGCVRVRPENINWLANTIPLYTTVYVTA